MATLFSFLKDGSAVGGGAFLASPPGWGCLRGSLGGPDRPESRPPGAQLLAGAARGSGCAFIVREGPTDTVIWNLKRKGCPWRLVCLELERRLVREVRVWGSGGGPF